MVISRLCSNKCCLVLVNGGYTDGYIRLSIFLHIKDDNYIMFASFQWIKHTMGIISIVSYLHCGLKESDES